jgi:hypothetical protein
MRGAVRSPETVMGQSFDEDERDRKPVDTAAVEKQVAAVVRAENLIPTSLVDEEVSWFFNELGIEPSYFLDTPHKKLGEHVLAIFAAKVSAKARGEKQPNLLFRNVEESRAVYFHTSNKGLRGSVLEIELDDTFLDSKTDHWTLESYRSIGKVSTEYQVGSLFFFVSFGLTPIGCRTSCGATFCARRRCRATRTICRPSCWRNIAPCWQRWPRPPSTARCSFAPTSASTTPAASPSPTR